MEENNEQLAAFVELLAQLSKELQTLYHSGDVQAFTDMNATVKAMYRIQHGNEDDAFKTIDPDCDVIYRNFDMIDAVLRTGFYATLPKQRGISSRCSGWHRGERL